jgi:hypothetical protein
MSGKAEREPGEQSRERKKEWREREASLIAENQAKLGERYVGISG